MDNAGAIAVGVAFEAMLLAPMLRPMLAGTDALGEYGLDVLAREIAARDAHGFAALVASRFASRP